MNGPFNHLPRPTRREWGAVVALLAIQAGLMGFSAWIHSPSVDEIGHLPAGISHWQLGRFELYRVGTSPLIFAGRSHSIAGASSAHPDSQVRGMRAARSSPPLNPGEQGKHIP